MARVSETQDARFIEKKNRKRERREREKKKKKLCEVAGLVAQARQEGQWAISSREGFIRMRDRFLQTSAYE